MIPDRFVRTAADHEAIKAGCYWSQEHADRIVKFVESFVAPQFVQGNKFKLLDWQADWLQQLYGWRLPNGNRRWRKVVMSIGKKAGKSLLTAAVCLYELLAAGTPSPLVISASTTKQNASQIFDTIKFSLDRHPALQKFVKVRPSVKAVRVPKLNGVFQSISSDSGNAEGLNVAFACLDEVHAWPNGKGERLYRALEYSSIARPDGCLCIISTAGHDQSHFFYDLVCKARNVLSGADLDTSFFATLYEPGPEDNPEDPATWRKANPSLGTSFTEDDFKRDLDAAKKNVPDWLSFLRYRLNTWTQSQDAWLDLDKWDKAEKKITEDQLKEWPCWMAADLSATTDPTSLSVCWHLGGKRFYLKSWAWVCKAGAKKREATNLPRYETYESGGWLKLTEGDVIDLPLLKNFIVSFCRTHKVKEITFDQYNADLLGHELISMYGPDFVTYSPQNFKFYNSPCKSFEMDISEGRLFHDGNRFLKWAAGNVRLDVDAWGNVRPSRDKSTDKIDPIISSLMAYARAHEFVSKNSTTESVYKSGGVFKF